MAQKIKYTKCERLNIRFAGSVDYDAVHCNELLFNATGRTGISNPWIFKEKQRISKKMVTY
ncbi:MAG: hypothetical protein ACETWK_09860 [Candidatus Aminicenantaceae bacterium]